MPRPPKFTIERLRDHLERAVLDPAISLSVQEVAKALAVSRETIYARHDEAVRSGRSKTEQPREMIAEAAKRQRAVAPGVKVRRSSMSASVEVEELQRQLADAKRQRDEAVAAHGLLLERYLVVEEAARRAGVDLHGAR